MFFKNAVNAFTKLDRLEAELKNLPSMHNAKNIALIERQAQEVALPPIRQGHQILERAGDNGSDGIRQCVCSEFTSIILFDTRTNTYIQ